MRGGFYEIKEMAAALVNIAGGTTFTEAARRAQVGYWGTRGTGRLGPKTTENGQTVADWLNQFGPVISEAHAEAGWPETVILDSTEFKWTDKNGKSSQLFVILAAWGYEAGASKGRLWRVEARPTDKSMDWQKFLRSLPGKPRSVVYDGDRSIGPAVKRVWRGSVPVHICEHHLTVNAGKALAADGQSHGTLRTLLSTAFHSLPEWEAFRDAVRKDGRCPETTQWVDYKDAALSLQTANRANIPAHYSTGPLDAALATIRQSVARRRWTFRNKERMDQLLDLMRLRINRLDNVEDWAECIRQHLEQNDGVPVRSRKIADPVTFDQQGERVYSLRK